MTFLAAQQRLGIFQFSRSDIATALEQPPSTVLRDLNRLKADGKIEQSGNTAASRYQLSIRYRTEASEMSAAPQAQSPTAAQLYVSPAWSPAATDLLLELDKPLGARTPVSYQRRFVDDYKPNETFLLPEALANELFQKGSLQGQQPAGTYARNVIAPLLIDLSFSSSKLEGNRYTKLDTEVLFRSGRVDPLGWPARNRVTLVGLSTTRGAAANGAYLSNTTPDLRSCRMPLSRCA